MYYMLAFNDAENIILYWDEPTITLDYDDHEFHSIIKNNWKNNLFSRRSQTYKSIAKKIFSKR